MPLLAVLQDFSAVADRTGTYTAWDYADIMEYLIGRWNVASRRDLTGEVRPRLMYSSSRLGAATS